MPSAEYRNKQERLNQFLDRHQLDGVLLQRRNNFAWITCGKDNHIPNNSPDGVAAILATRDSRICFTNTIEEPRFRDEELAATGISVVSYPWHDSAAATRLLTELVKGRQIGSDVNDMGELRYPGVGLLPLPTDFRELRWQLTDAEIARYRDGGQRTALAAELTARQVKPGMSEHEIAGILDHEVRKTGCRPVVNLIAADHRVEQFRHPIPTDYRATRYVMLVICAEFAGLISNLTRLVSFKPISAELKRKHQAVCDVDAAVNLSTRPGRTLGDMFAILRNAYSTAGCPNEIELHHQGGSTGYAGREAFADPISKIKVLDRQAFAWNPSITGTKCEDTVLCKTGGIEVLTKPGSDWPKVVGRFGDQSLERADILVLG